MYILLGEVCRGTVVMSVVNAYDVIKLVLKMATMVNFRLANIYSCIFLFWCVIGNK